MIFFFFAFFKKAKEMENNWTSRAWEIVNNMVSWEVRDFFPFKEHSTDIMKTVNDKIVAISDYILIFTFFKGKLRV